MRVTHRTLTVLAVVAEHPGASNHDIAEQAGVTDQSQISKLLAWVERLELIQNTGGGHSMGAPNAWQLTTKGAASLKSA